MVTSVHTRVAACATALAATLLGVAAGPRAPSASAACPDANAGVGEVAGPRLAAATTCLVNQERVRRGLEALAPDPTLERAALAHATDMADRGFFAHVNPEGQRASDRARVAGYEGHADETLARGSSTPAQIVAGWMESFRHRRVILDPTKRAIGVGVSRTLWAASFGDRIASDTTRRPAGGGATRSTARATDTLPAKLAVRRAEVKGGRLDMLVDATARAAGDTVRMSFIAAGRRSSFSRRIPSSGRLRVDPRLPAAQRGVTTGIMELDYAGSERVRPASVRLRVARRRALLRRDHLSLHNGVLRARGTVRARARGVVRLTLGYVRDDGSVAFWRGQAPIDAGRWEITAALPAEAAGGGHLSIQFTGYYRGRVRGEQLAKELLAGQAFE